MPKVIVKSRYITNRVHMAQYLRYIATREGVELLPDAVKGHSATDVQRQFIKQHEKEMEGLHEYKYYLYCPTIENASNTITAYAQSGYDRQNEYEQYARSGGIAKDSDEGRDKPATQKQKEWIIEHIGNLSDLLEYEDYVKSPTVCNASELITAIAEYNTTDPEIYLKYMAERPGVDKDAGDAHGLWNMTGKADLDSELEKVMSTNGVAWTHIISLRREDAHNLSFEKADAWRKIVAANAGRIAKLYNIDMKNLNILGAFHNEGHHPHIHLFVYSNDKHEGIIPKKQMVTAGERMRSMFTNSIFSQGMEPLITRRNELRAAMNERVKTISTFYGKKYKENSEIELLLTTLSKDLPKEGKLQYGYLKPEIKERVNDTLRRIIVADGNLNALVSEYFALQHKLFEQYNDNPEKIEEKDIDFLQHFYEPRSGKYAGKRDITALHNIIIQCAAISRSGARTKVNVKKGKTVNIVSNSSGIQEKPEALPAEVSVIATGNIAVEKQKSSEDEPELVPVDDVKFKIYDAKGTPLQEEMTDANGHAIFRNLPEGTYTVEDSQKAAQSRQSNDFAIKYAAITAARLIASELVALCDTVEACSRPQKTEKTWQHRHFKLRNKNQNIKEDISR